MLQSKAFNFEHAFNTESTDFFHCIGILWDWECPKFPLLFTVFDHQTHSTPKSIWSFPLKDWMEKTCFWKSIKKIQVLTNPIESLQAEQAKNSQWHWLFSFFKLFFSKTIRLIFFQLMCQSRVFTSSGELHTDNWEGIRFLWDWKYRKVLLVFNSLDLWIRFLNKELSWYLPSASMRTFWHSE